MLSAVCEVVVSCQAEELLCWCRYLGIKYSLMRCMGVKLTRSGVGTWYCVCVHLYITKVIPSSNLVLIELTS